jgi:hypothetical protein
MDFELLFTARGEAVTLGNSSLAGMARADALDKANPRQTHLNFNTDCGIVNANNNARRGAMSSGRSTTRSLALPCSMIHQSKSSFRLAGDEHGLINPNVSALGDWTWRREVRTVPIYRLLVYARVATKEQLGREFDRF